MAKQFFLFKWIKGWRLDKFFDELFNSRNANGEVSVKDAAAKVINVIDQVLAIANGPDAALIEAVISDEGQASIEDLKLQLTEIKTKLTEIETLLDISEGLKDYRFDENDKTNDFYHSLVSTAALAFNDGQISTFEAISFAAQVALFIKDED